MHSAQLWCLAGCVARGCRLVAETFFRDGGNNDGVSAVSVKAVVAITKIMLVVSGNQCLGCGRRTFLLRATDGSDANA